MENNKQNFQKKAELKNTKPDYFLNYVSSEKYVIEWGTNKFWNVSKDTFDVLGSGSLEFYESNSKYIVLSQPCGSGCAFYVLLPLEPNKKEIAFWNVVFFDLDEEIIITTLDPGLGKFRISNFGRNTKQEIIFTDLCPAADKPMCIDSIFIKNGEVYFQYQGSKWEFGKPDQKIMKVKF